MFGWHHYLTLIEPCAITKPSQSFKFIFSHMHVCMTHLYINPPDIPSSFVFWQDPKILRGRYVSGGLHLDRKINLVCGQRHECSQYDFTHFALIPPFWSKKDPLFFAPKASNLFLKLTQVVNFQYIFLSRSARKSPIGPSWRGGVIFDRQIKTPGGFIFVVFTRSCGFPLCSCMHTDIWMFYYQRFLRQIFFQGQ